MFYIFLLISILILQTFAKCPTGSISSFSDDNDCLFFNSTPAAYFIAEKSCQSLGGHLVVINDMLDNMFISQEAVATFKDQTEFWFGATDIISPPKWAWLDNSTMSFNNWANNKAPTDDGKNCGTITSNDGIWKADTCNTLKPYVCEVKISASSTVASSTTTTTTKSSITTTTPDQCVDTIDNCHNYLQLCSNPNYQKLMYKECRRTCNLCKLCLDADDRCPQWARNGFCSNPFYQNIWHECKKSCNFCT